MLNQKIKVEFFHDVICSFCYPMSYRMRRISEEFPQIEIVHRAYALSPDENLVKMQFGSRQDQTKEVIEHWFHANENDDLHRFQIQKMKESGHLIPLSMPMLKAAAAAQPQGRYWDMFDALQKALFTEARDLNEEQTLIDLAEEIGLDVETWKKDFKSQSIDDKVVADLSRGIEIGINSVPALVIQDKYLISGAQPMMHLMDAFEQIIKEFSEESKSKLVNLSEETTNEDGQSCHIDDSGNMVCDI